MSRVERGLVALGMTVGLGAGVGYAVHEVNDLNSASAALTACVYNHVNTGPACLDGAASLPEAASMQASAQTYGELGWIAFFGAVTAFGETMIIVRKED